MDFTGVIMWRIFIKYRWIINGPTMEIRRLVICGHFEVVSRTNAARATSRLAPMTFAEQEVTLKDVLVKNGVSPEVPLPAIPKSMSQNAAGQQANNAGPSGASNKPNNNNSGSKPQRKPATHNGHPVCYGYNSTDNRVWRNTATAGGSGCKNKEGKYFSHVCNVYVKDKSAFCLGKHPRADHK